MTSKTIRESSKLLRNDFLSNNRWGIPMIKKNIIDLSTIYLIGYNNVKVNESDGNGKIVHFFIDDNKFSGTFDDAYAHSSNSFELYSGNSFCCAKKLAQYEHVITLDFSVYPEMPLAVQLMSTFKNRWVGAYWQSRNLSVIPSVSWGNEESFEFCFLGIEPESIVAISTLRCRRNPESFLRGYNQMLTQLKPQTIICYGKPIDGMSGNVVWFPYARSKKEAV